MTNSWTGIVVRPTLKLQDARHERSGNECYGRGRGTAAARGYNAELLSAPLVGKDYFFSKWSPGPWVDICEPHPSGVLCYIEVKTAVEQFPSGGAGRFRIWMPNHTRLLTHRRSHRETKGLYLYLFLVYTVKSGVEREIGKVVVPAESVDAQIDSWNRINHVTMGEVLTYTVSWRKLINSLGVSITEFTSQPTVDLTESSEPLKRARSHTDF
jgi:hypothetical protein